jgi:hypothetical protein
VVTGNIEEYWFESQMLGPNMEVHEDVANANIPQVLFVPTASYAMPVDPMDPYMPADGEKYDVWVPVISTLDVEIRKLVSLVSIQPGQSIWRTRMLMSLCWNRE